MVSEPGYTGNPCERGAAVLGAAAVDQVVCVPRLPGTDQIVLADSCTRCAGGTGANIAAALVKLGCRAGLLGKIGDDEDGRFLRSCLEEAAVDLSGLRVAAGERSARCFIALDPQGQRVIYALGGAALIQDPAELDEDSFRGFHMLCICDAYPEVALAAARFAHRAGQTVVFAPGGLMVSLGLQVLKPVLSLTQILVVSRTEAGVLSGGADPGEAAHQLSREGPEVVIVTLGAEGCLVWNDNGFVRLPAYPAPRVRDTTGAGDAFTAGILSGFLSGMDWRSAADFGNAVAALKVGAVGAQQGVPGREEVLNWMDRYRNRDRRERETS